MRRMEDTVLHQALLDVKLTSVRRAISAPCYRRSPLQTFGWLAFDLALYLAMMAGVLRSDSSWAQLGFGVGAGVAVAMMFVWAHDAAHGALFRSEWTAELLGTTLMLPSLNPYRLWCHGHNRVHHGFTSYSPIDWIWRPLSPDEYRALGLWRRLIYRLERTPWGCALHYILRVWWPGMVLFRPDPRSRERVGFAVSKAVTLGFGLALTALCWWAGGVVGVVAGVVIPFLVFNYFIALFIFLHHTHPSVPFFDHRPEWSNTIGQVYCSVVVRCSRVSELLTHNIMVHVPHHVDPRIPFYRLHRAYADLQAAYAPFLHEYRFRWRTVAMIFRRCKLYDFDRKIWYTYREAL